MGLKKYKYKFNADDLLINISKSLYKKYKVQLYADDALFCFTWIQIATVLLV